MSEEKTNLTFTDRDNIDLLVEFQRYQHTERYMELLVASEKHSLTHKRIAQDFLIWRATFRKGRQSV